jgi:hypothetical protein
MGPNYSRISKTGYYICASRNTTDVKNILTEKNIRKERMPSAVYEVNKGPTQKI